MRVSRTRFSKRRVKRKTEFPLIAVVQKKKKSPAIKPALLFSRPENNEQGDRKEIKSPTSPSRNAAKKGGGPRGEKKSRATIDYKNVILLRSLITAEGKILPRRINKLTAKQQRSVQKAIKTARVMGLVPFINKSRPF